MWWNFGVIALETDLRWKVTETASLAKRCAAKVVGLMGMPTGTTIDLESCTTLREIFLEHGKQLLLETGGTFTTLQLQLNCFKSYALLLEPSPARATCSKASTTRTSTAAPHCLHRKNKSAPRRRLFCFQAPGRSSRQSKQPRRHAYRCHEVFLFWEQHVHSSHRCKWDDQQEAGSYPFSWR